MEDLLREAMHEAARVIQCGLPPYHHQNAIRFWKLFAEAGGDFYNIPPPLPILTGEGNPDADLGYRTILIEKETP